MPARAFPETGSIWSAAARLVGVRRPDAGPGLEGTNHGPRKGDRSTEAERPRKDGRRDHEATSGRVRVWWCSARSLHFSI
jgi:hypothetical protein